MNVKNHSRLHIIINGVVQGVGFRPFVYNLAHCYQLYGYVLNDGRGVVIDIEGKSESLKAFVSDLQRKKPPLAKIYNIEFQEEKLRYYHSFEIRNSQQGSISTMLGSDISMCEECLAEFRDRNNRRYRYPFINCTNCGVRYTIIKKLPYDRKNTSMSDFQMCNECLIEYEDPTNRRYHAQPISCYNCGPQLFFRSSEGTVLYGDSALHEAIAYIKAKKRIAVKGMGGFHLVCDARDDDAILDLRKKKNRPLKPFAIMLSNLNAVQDIAVLSQNDKKLILENKRPIVIVQKKREQKLSKYVAPNIDVLGVFLAYTPLHQLILDGVDGPLIATSANLSDEPIITTEDEIFNKFANMVEGVLYFDREIVNGCDDSVVMGIDESYITLRASRGVMPRSFYIKHRTPKKILAVGANQKNTISLCFENNIIVSPHIGDLNSLGAFEYFERTVDFFKKVYNFEPDIVVCDKHPNYETSKWAKQYVAERDNVELIEVQHHYAHALSVMAEHALDEDVLAFCFDGTGYGDDGLLWGGEVFLASPQKYTRIYSLQNISLLGGEKAIKEPKRVALALLFEIYTLEELEQLNIPLLKAFNKEELQTLYIMKEKSLNTPYSSSVGRLFDGIYALCGYIKTLGFEGESGMVLESLAKKYRSEDHYSYELVEGRIEYTKMIYEILNEKEKNFIASKFINTLTEIIVDISLQHKGICVVLAGGVFQNKVLLQKLTEAFAVRNIKYFLPKEIAINDGGISFGQVYFGLKGLNE
ncbi:carbamoyltransferase HypF [Sulfurimonas sp.]